MTASLIKKIRLFFKGKKKEEEKKKEESLDQKREGKRIKTKEFKGPKKKPSARGNNSSRKKGGAFLKQKTFPEGSRREEKRRTPREKNSENRAGAKGGLVRKQKVGSIFNVEASFKGWDLKEELLQALEENEFKHPSEAQEKTIPLALKGRNLVCSSATGSGKTLAFAVPVVDRLLKGQVHQALVLSPTREIAIQTNKLFELLMKKTKLRSGLVIGGTDVLEQKQILREYPPLLVATPGRLVDMLERGLVWLEYTELVVIDETDRMLDLGFEKELSLIFKELKSGANLLMFTATLMPEVEAIVKNYMKEYALVTVGAAVRVSENIEHVFLQLKEREKLRVVKELLRKRRELKILLFRNTIVGTNKLASALRQGGFQGVASLHSKKSQEERNRALEGFRRGRIKTLVATDVAGRGIDIAKIDLVLNYEVPRHSEEYIHRIGRTGRGEFIGKALTLVGEREGKTFDNLVRLLKQGKEEVEIKIAKSLAGVSFLQRKTAERVDK